jgi:Cu/Ag efflux protein CusF
MKKILATLVATVAFAAAAFAGEVEGVVKAFDAATKTVTLEDDSAFTLADGVAVDGIVAGAKVKITFDDATKAASAVEVAKM